MIWCWWLCESGEAIGRLVPNGAAADGLEMGGERLFAVAHPLTLFGPIRDRQFSGAKS